ncbi:DUF202 domain-containing protein [Streptomyces sp. B-S-A8]|uniref:DUF202 domain-containing protein n=1 Tax=Streptomyces solicavernae TaxID=3043614 RepID=A0ABT6RWG1_9ACTN|nr:DUF202 domain-containing protein [Streptomyces sp. B-S-A8]MDI3388775.1 DUF202 domain-containing protein [Streptomyces sp. B-S-A8]
MSHPGHPVRPATPERDPGLQPERTRLAWRRTTLSCTVAAVLAGKQALHGGAGPLALVGAGLSVGLWLAFVVLANRRIHALAHARPAPMRKGTALGAAGITVGLAVFAVAVVR